MTIVVCSTPEQYAQLMLRGIPVGVTIVMQSCDETVKMGADIYFDLLFDDENDVFRTVTQKPVLVNAVIQNNSQLPDNYIRMNGWNSFLERDILEIAARDNTFFTRATALLDELGWKYQVSPDTPGMIAARVVAMVINEAYFALNENISSKEEIDTAMKTGTNYPYGPFEWGEKIGLEKIVLLLTKLSEEDERYRPAEGMGVSIGRGGLG